MKAGHLVSRIQKSSLGDGLWLLRVSLAISWVQGSRELKLQAVDNVIVKLDVGEQVVGVGPALGESDAVLAIGIFCLRCCSDRSEVIWLATRDLESHIGGGSGLDLEGSRANREILAQQIVGGLAEVL